MEFKHAQSDVRIMAISGKSEIILGRQNSIYVYSMEDSLISTADLKTLIFDVAFHFGIDKLLISDELISGSVVIYDHDSKEEKTLVTKTKCYVAVKGYPKGPALLYFREGTMNGKILLL